MPMKGDGSLISFNNANIKCKSLQAETTNFILWSSMKERGTYFLYLNRKCSKQGREARVSSHNGNVKKSPANKSKSALNSNFAKAL